MAHNCLALINPMYQPAMRPIVAIGNGNPTVITTGTVDAVGVVTLLDHLYINGTLLRVDVPDVDGMSEINGLIGEVTVIDATSFEISIDSDQFSAFSIPADADPTYNPHVCTCAFVVPVGENNAQLTAAVHNIYG
jgi:hypothetical protein